MSKKWFRSHVERQLEDIWDVRRLIVDADRDYPFTHGSAAGWVKVDTRLQPWMAVIFAHAALDVPGSKKLMAELNDLNRSSRSATLIWADGLVIVKQAVMADAVSRFTMAQALDAVGSIADEIGTMIASVFGGCTPEGSAAANTAE